METDLDELPLARALALCGGPTGLSRQLKKLAGRDVLPATISAWMRRAGGRVPAEYCPDVQLATHNAVTCKELRPDVKWWVLRIHVGEAQSDAANDPISNQAA